MKKKEEKSEVKDETQEALEMYGASQEERDAVVSGSMTVLEMLERRKEDTRRISARLDSQSPSQSMPFHGSTIEDAAPAAPGAVTAHDKAVASLAFRAQEARAAQGDQVRDLMKSLEPLKEQAQAMLVELDEISRTYGRMLSGLVASIPDLYAYRMAHRELREVHRLCDQAQPLLTTTSMNLRRIPQRIDAVKYALDPRREAESIRKEIGYQAANGPQCRRYCEQIAKLLPGLQAALKYAGAPVKLETQRIDRPRDVVRVIDSDGALHTYEVGR